MISDDPGAPTRGRCRTPSLDSAPMSADGHLHDPPRPRTEVDVAGAAIVAILDARIVPFTPGMIGRLSTATGAPVATIKEGVGAEGFGAHGVVRPIRRPIAEEPTVEAMARTAPEPRFARNYTGNMRAANEVSPATKERVLGQAHLFTVSGAQGARTVRDQGRGHWRPSINVHGLLTGASARSIPECGAEQAADDLAPFRRLRRRSSRGGLHHLPSADRDTARSRCRRCEAAPRQLPKRISNRCK
jgi:hypothetical protein